MEELNYNKKKINKINAIKHIKKLILFIYMPTYFTTLCLQIMKIISNTKEKKKRWNFLDIFQQIKFWGQGEIIGIGNRIKLFWIKYVKMLS